MASETRIPKPVAVLAAVLIVVSGAGLVTAAAIGGGETIQRLAQGDPTYLERGLSHRTITLAVIVRAMDDAESRPLPVQGATVIIGKPGETERLARAETDESGRALFELRPGRYAIGVMHNDSAARHALPLFADTRVAALIDEEGAIHFHTQTRGHLRDSGAAYNLFIRVGEAANGTRSPVAGAMVLLEHYGRGEPQPVARNETNERGGAAFYPPAGVYAATVITPDGDEAKFRVRLAGPQAFAVLFHEDGNVTVNQVRPGRM